jgi:hypothetical protein
MDTRKGYALIFALMLLAGAALVAVTWAAPGKAPLAGGAPTVVAYQGEVRVSGTPYTGNGYFKFAVVNAAGSTSYWSNDGTSASGGAPTAAVQLAVSDGVFSVLLGDTTLGGMTQAMTAGVFSQPNRYLRVWFSTGASGTYSQLTPDTRIASVPYALQAQKVAGYQNVVVVAKSGGDYTSVQAAIDSITDAVADNAYLVWVAPGLYEEQVTMKPYIHLQGAGQEATIISSTVSSSDWPPAEATLLLTSTTSVRGLTLGHSGTGNRNIALMATAGTTRTLVADVTARALGSGTKHYGIFLVGSGVGVELQQVTALAENGSDGNYGLVCYAGVSASLHGGSFTARGGADARGIGLADSSTMLDTKNVTVLGENSSGYNRGLFNENGAAAMLHGGSFTGRGGTDARGIHNIGSGTTLETESVIALAKSGSNNTYGLANEDGAEAVLQGGSFTGRGGGNAIGIYNLSGTLGAKHITALGENGSFNNGLYQVGGTVRLAFSQLVGDATHTTGMLVCYGVYDGDYAFYNCP